MRDVHFEGAKPVTRDGVTPERCDPLPTCGDDCDLPRGDHEEGETDRGSVTPRLDLHDYNR